MPLIDVKTNVMVSKEAGVALKSALGQAITAIPGKTETWLMVGIQPNYTLYFDGDGSPAAMVDVAILGGATASAYNDLTARICDILNHQLSIPMNRIYIKYSETENWGWNGSNF